MYKMAAETARVSNQNAELDGNTSVTSKRSQPFDKNLVRAEEEENEEENHQKQSSRVPPQSWPRPQQPRSSQQTTQEHQQARQQEAGERRKSVTFGPAIRSEYPPPRPPVQGVIRRGSPWAVLRARLPTAEGLPPEHPIHRMQNSGEVRPRPPMSRPGSQEGPRGPMMGPRPSSAGPRPPIPIRPPSRASRDDDEDVVIGGDPRLVSRPPSGQKGPMTPQAPLANSPNLQNATPQTQTAPLRQNMMRTPYAPPQTNAYSTDTQSQPQNIGSTVQSQNGPPNMAPYSRPHGLSGPQQASSGGPGQSMGPQQPAYNPPSQTLQKQPSFQSQSQPPLTQPPSATTASLQNPSQNVEQQNIPTSVTPSAGKNLTPGPTAPNISSVSPSRNPELNTRQGSLTSRQEEPTGKATPQDGRTSMGQLKITKENDHSNKVINQMENIPSQKLFNQNGENAVSSQNLADTQPKTKMFKENEPGKVTTQNIPETVTKPKPPVVVETHLKKPHETENTTMKGKAAESDKVLKESEQAKPAKSETLQKENSQNKQNGGPVLNGSHDSPKRGSTPGKAAPPRKLGTSPTPAAKSPSKLSPKTPDTPSTADKKKVPMNKIQVGAAPSPNLKSVKSKIGSLENAKHKPGGGNVKIEHRKLNFNVQPKIEAKNETYTPGGGDKKIQQAKLQWNAKSKIGSLENAAHKPGGGAKKIESVKLDFKDKAKPKVGSKDNIKHIAGGGAVKNAENSLPTGSHPDPPHRSSEDLGSPLVEIEEQKVEIKAQSKIGSLDNVKHRPGGGDKRIFDDKEYLKQTASASSDSLNQEKKKRSRCNSSSSHKSTEDKSSKSPTDQNSNQVNQEMAAASKTSNERVEIKHGGGKMGGEPGRDSNGNGKAQVQSKQPSKDSSQPQLPKANVNIIENRQKLVENGQKRSQEQAAKVEAPSQNLVDNTIVAKNEPSRLHASNAPESQRTQQTLQQQHFGKINPQMPSNQPNIPNLPANVHMAKDLFRETGQPSMERMTDNRMTAGKGIVDKSQFEKLEKDVHYSPQQEYNYKNQIEQK